MKEQLNQEIADVFTVFSWFYSSPDAWHHDMSEEVWDSFINKMAEVWNVSTPLEWKAVQDYQTLKESYTFYFSNGFKTCALPIESIYKPWTQDSSCTLPFARSKGYLLGDSAYHMFYLLDSFQMELPDEYANTPDHLVILIDLLSVLYRYSRPSFIADYLQHHFDWLRDFRDELKKQSEEDSFYLAITNLLIEVIDQEQSRIKEQHEISFSL